MNHTLKTLLLVVLGVVLPSVPLVIAMGHALETRTTMRAAISQATETMHLARRIVHLRESQWWVAAGERPTEDVVGSVRHVLRDAGLSEDALVDLRSESDAPIPGGTSSGPSLRLQTITFTLRPVTVADVGAFLTLWRERTAAWRVSRVVLTASLPTGRERSRSATADSTIGRFDAVISVSAIYSGEPGP